MPDTEETVETKPTEVKTVLLNSGHFHCFPVPVEAPVRPACSKGKLLDSERIENIRIP